MPIAIRRILAVALACLTAFALAPTPARAGGWALTVLDPLPERVEAGRTYTVGMWLLQHGFHPYEGEDLGAVELRLVGTDRQVSAYPAVALKDPAHFAATVVVPRDGRYTVVAKQGWFADYRIGTLTVPGGLDVLPVPVALTDQHIAQYWPGAAHPPVLPVDTSRDVFTEAAGVPPSTAAAQPAARTATDTAEPSSPSTPRMTILAGLAALLVVGTVLLNRRRLLARRRPT